MDIEILVGKTIKEIILNSDELMFKTADDKTYVMNHFQECCEDVHIEDICGDLKDLIGSVIVTARENINSGGEDDFTWTFYDLATAKGSVTIRWYGVSNGYYSERVSFEEQEKA